MPLRGRGPASRYTLGRSDLMGFHEEMIEYDPSPIIVKGASAGMTIFMLQRYAAVLDEMVAIARAEWERGAHQFAAHNDSLLGPH